MFTDAQRERLRSGAELWGLTLDGATVDRFARFADMLEEGNRRLNLTRVPPSEYDTLHFLDSLALAAVLPPKPGMSLLDVGTGAGFPGLPLALVFPELRVTLMDGTRKRLDFLDEVIVALGLNNVRTLHGRAEEVARLPAHRQRYDLVTARAVAKMPQLAQWLLPLVRPGGLAVAYKSRETDPEVAEADRVLKQLGGECEQVVEVALPGTEIVRRLVLIRRTERGRK
ncbi:MAG: rRNA m(7)G-527 methyltransferase [Chthonomonadaceae bacterium]|nr:rRNA m(7)G-527 methyltransferase [Chthonomonadaceae bacterium]